METTETALVARLLGEPFEPAPTGPAAYRRTLEYDNVGPDLPLDQPLCVDGMEATLHLGYRGNGHVLVECALDLPFVFADPFDLSQRESLAREQTMAFAATLARDIPAFETAYLSGASYELCGMHAPRLQPPERCTPYCVSEKC